MAKDLPYFKFFVSEWILGRIYDYPDKVQGAFLIAICHYWNKNCEYNSIDFERKIGKKRFNLLLELKFIEVENEIVYISFLDEQHSERTGIQQSRIKGGLARAKQMQEQKNSYIEENNKRGEEKRRDNKDLKFSFRKSLSDLGANENLINDWLLVRKNKKATNSETAFNLLKNEFEVSGLDINDILKICVLNSWSGFKKDWLKNTLTTQATGSKFDNIVKTVNNAHDEIRAKYNTNNG